MKARPGLGEQLLTSFFFSISARATDSKLRNPRSNGEKAARQPLMAAGSYPETVRIRWLKLVIAFTLIDATLNVVPGINAGASSDRSSATSSSVMTSTSLGLGTEVDSVDMIDSTRGFAVVSNSIAGMTNHYYMARTSDVGNKWTIVGRLPYPPFKGVPSWNLPTLDFVTTSVGYVSAPGGGRVFVTDDGGRTWQSLSTPGIWPTYRVRGDSTLVVSDMCTGRLPNYGPLQCPSVVSRYRLGLSAYMLTCSNKYRLICRSAELQVSGSGHLPSG